MRLYLVRHGESEANVQRIISNRTLPHGLTSLGRQQALGLAGRLRNEAITRIYASPLLRATETAAILSDELGVPFETAGGLCEYDQGILEGRSDEASWAQVHEIARDWIVNRNWDRKPEGGESFHDARERFVPWLEGLVREYGASDERLLLVGHGGVYHVLLPLVLTNVSYEFAAAHRIGNSDLIVVEPGEEGLVCLEWCGVKPAG